MTVPGKHQLYYQPFGTKERYWLFDTKGFSSSIFAYFRDYGRNMNDMGFSLTLNELYKDKRYHRNTKLTKLIARIPAYVEYAIREYIAKSEEAYEQCDKVHELKYSYSVCDDCKYAA